MGRVCLLSDRSLASQAGDGSLLPAELTIMIKVGAFHGYFPPLGPHPRLQVWGELAIIFLHKDF